MAKLSRRDFIKACSGMGVLGAMALAVGEPKRIAKNFEGALGAVDQELLGGSALYLSAQDDYRAGLGVKKLKEPKWEIKGTLERWTHAFTSTGISNWYGGPGKDNVPQEWHDRYAAEEAFQGITRADCSALSRQVRADKLAAGESGWTLLDQALQGTTSLIAKAVTYPATPGMGEPNNIYWGTEINQPARGFSSWKPLKTPTYLSLKVPKYAVTDKEEMSHFIKKAATLFGADLVGICHIDRRFVWTQWYDYVYTHRPYPIYFTDEPGCPKDPNGEDYKVPTILDDGTQIIPKEFEYAVMMVIQEHVSFYRCSPSRFHSADNVRAYSRGATLVAMLATFIRNLGYNAIPFQNDTASKHPEAIEAGLGETGRQRDLASPEFGPLQRLFGVITDLPLEVDHPIDFGFRELCKECIKCAKACPMDAISFEIEPTDGYERNDVKAPIDIEQLPGKVVWHVNRLRCRKGSSAVGGCSNCKAACPWSQPSNQWQDRVKWMSINMGGVGRSVLLWMYDVFGYGKKLSPADWWKSAVRPISGLSDHRRNH